MTTETTGSSGQPSALARWLRLLAAALVLLLLSETLWLWQTWPVRELLQPAAQRVPLPAPR